MARGAGGSDGALPDPAVESAPVSNAKKAFAVALLAALAWAVAPVAEAQAPIRIGAALGQNQLRG